MPDPIKIKKVQFDFSMEKEELAFELNSRWTSFFQSGFVRIVERVLNRFDKSSHHLQIDRMELDLGVIEEADFFEKFPLLLEEKLEEVMLQYLSDSSNRSCIREIAGEEVLFEAFTWYLLHGYFPWHVDEKYKDPQLLLQTILKTNSQAFRKFLFTNGHNTALRTRLVQQLNDSELEKLVELTEPSESSFIIGYFRFLQENYNSIKQPDIRENEYRNAVWYLIVTYLLESRGSYFNRKSFVNNTIAGLAGRYNMSISNLLNYLVVHIPLFKQQHSGIPDLFRILNELSREDTGNVNPQGGSLPKKEEKQQNTTEERESIVRRFRSRLSEVNGKGKPLENIRLELISLLQNPQSRKEFLANFRDEEMFSLVELLEPSEARFVHSWADSLCGKDLPGRAGGEFQLLKWEFLITTLLEGRGRSFNRGAFMRRVLSQIASHYHLSREEEKELCSREDERSESPLESEVLESKGKNLRVQFYGWLNGDYMPKNTLTGLRTKLIELLLQPLSRKEFLADMREEEIYRLADLVEAREAPFVISYAKALDEEKERGALEGRAGSEFRLLKWDFIFMALLEERGSRFNRKSFIRSVLFMISAHYNLNLTQVLEHLYRAIIEQKIGLEGELASLLKETYFEWKEQRSRESGGKQLERIAKEVWYANALKDFITTGLIVDKYFDNRMYEVFAYLKNYRPDLLLTILEDLKGGFVLEDRISSSSHKKLYRELIVHLVATYSLNLPGGRRVKSLFENIEEDRFAGVPVKAFKMMLAACLRNEFFLFETAWNVLTDSEEKNGGSQTGVLSFLPDEFLPDLFNRKYSPDWVKRHQKEIFDRLFSSSQSFQVLIQKLRINRESRDFLFSVMDQNILQLLVEKLPCLGYGKVPVALIREMAIAAKLDEKLGREIFVSLLFNYLMDLQWYSEMEATKQFLSACLKRIGNDEERIQMAQELIAGTESLSDNSNLTGLIHLVLREMGDSIQPTSRGEVKEIKNEEVILDLLVERFGSSVPASGIQKSSPSGNRMVDATLFRALEQLLRTHPERMKEQWAKGILDGVRLMQWLKDAPVSLKWEWIRVMSDTYVRTFVEQILRMQSWMEQIYREQHLGSFPAQILMDQLLEFSVGKYRNLNRQQFLQTLFQELLKNTRPEKQKTIMDNLKKCAEKSDGTFANLLEQVQKVRQANGITAREKDISVPPQPVSVTENVEEGEVIYIKNAGLVIAGAFLPVLFDRLNLLEGRMFRNRSAKERAAICLQYMAYNRTSFPEHELVLNKVLVGLHPSDPVDTSIELTDQEKKTIDSLVQGIIENWRKLQNTSVQALQETFLVRGGSLTKKENNWHLVVEQKAYDILIDYLPWNYTTIKNLWMDDVLYTKWR